MIKRGSTCARPAQEHLRSTRFLGVRLIGLGSVLRSLLQDDGLPLSPSPRYRFIFQGVAGYPRYAYTDSRNGLAMEQAKKRRRKNQGNYLEKERKLLQVKDAAEKARRRGRGPYRKSAST